MTRLVRMRYVNLAGPGMRPPATALPDGRPVYDVVNREGALIDRVVLPPYRSIAGFGSGVVYLAVKDPNAVVHLERVRIK